MKNLKLKLLERLGALKASDNAIALGFACGAGISMTPFIGFHSILAILSAWMMHASIPSALIGTIVGNPWTFALIWPATYETGRLILSINARSNIDFIMIFKNLKEAFLKSDYADVLLDVKEVIVPMIVGSVLFYAATFLISFFGIKQLLKRVRKNTPI